ncbi:hypothetical protein H4Q26_000544 [Puccinia striiformis f. sp. tritici PST-130]|nr:hypothetical protein H4Q26_000544 [Puccinia striiformis f. sp. tritici PST-130]
MGFTKPSSHINQVRRTIQNQKSSNAHNAFMGRNRRDIDSQHFLGPIKSRVTYFNGSMTWMKGKALVKNGEEDLFCEFEGDPNFIERRFGGNVKRPREKAMDEDPVPPAADEELTGTQPEPKTQNTSERVVNPQTVKETQAAREVPLPSAAESLIHLVWHSAPWLMLSFKALTKDPLATRDPEPVVVSVEKEAVGPHSPSELHEEEAVVPPAKCRPRKQLDERQPSDRRGSQPNIPVLAGPSTSKIGMDAGEWAHPVTHSAKVGVWLEQTAEAGSQAPVDAPRSRAPSSIAGVVIA